MEKPNRFDDLWADLLGKTALCNSPKSTKTIEDIFDHAKKELLADLEFHS